MTHEKNIYTASGIVGSVFITTKLATINLVDCCFDLKQVESFYENTNDNTTIFVNFKSGNSICIVDSFKEFKEYFLTNIK